ncbi:uncharacterized protein TNCV_1179801 [Trichonephila clavipes]|nr:uncharacterized protein TNCV_1179801 [Trichonephila clavipes]
MACGISEDERNLVFLMSKDHVTVIPLSQISNDDDPDPDIEIEIEPDLESDLEPDLESDLERELEPGLERELEPGLDPDVTGEPSCSYDASKEMVRLRCRRKSLPGYPTDDALICCVLQRLPMKDFAAEVRASMDVDQFLNQAVLLLDVQDTSVEGIIDKMLHKTGSAGQPGRGPLIETSDNPREQGLENTAGGVGLPISTFPSMSRPLLQHGVEHCPAVKPLYHVSRCTAAVCLLMLGSNALIAFDNDRL